MDKNKMARRRLVRNRGLEKYVKIDDRGYVAYLHPAMAKAGKKPERFGKDIDRANRFAREFARLQSQASDLSGHAAMAYSGLSADKLLSDVITGFKAQYIPMRKWSDSYTAGQVIRLDKISTHIGDRGIRTLTVLDLKNAVYDLFAGDGIRQAKNIMIHLYRFAIGEGWCDPVNLPELINVPGREKRKRARVPDKEAYLEKRDDCPAWLQDAMDLAVITLLRRTDICELEIKKHLVKIDGEEYIRRIHKKTGYAVEILVDEKLKPIIQRCRERAMSLGCPFLICTPQRDTSITRKAKQHRCQVLPAYLTGQYGRHTGSQFHELRSLGERLMKQAGYTPAEIRALGGWSTEKMRQLYDEDDEVKFTRARCGVTIG